MGGLGGGDVLMMLLMLPCLGIIIGGWVYCIVYVARDTKKRDPERAVFWLALVIFAGPIGLIAWMNARP